MSFMSDKKPVEGWISSLVNIAKANPSSGADAGDALGSDRVFSMYCRTDP